MKVSLVADPRVSCKKLGKAERRKSQRQFWMLPSNLCRRGTGGAGTAVVSRFAVLLAIFR